MRLLKTPCKPVAAATHRTSCGREEDDHCSRRPGRTTSILQLSKSIFIVTFNGTESIHTTVTPSGDVVASCLCQTYESPSDYIVGMATESYFSPVVEHPIALLQLCVCNRCLIFQLKHADRIPDLLHRFLLDPHFVFVGVGIKDDDRRLIEDVQMSVLNSVDLRILASHRTGQPEMRSMKLKDLALRVMGVDVNVTMSPWDRWRLKPDQIMYACIDAFVSFEVGRRLYDGAF